MTSVTAMFMAVNIVSSYKIRNHVVSLNVMLFNDMFKEI